MTITKKRDSIRFEKEAKALKKNLLKRKKQAEELKKLKEVFPADMKAAVLQAAMQGKLTEQLETDTPVSELLPLFPIFVEAPDPSFTYVFVTVAFPFPAFAMIVPLFDVLATRPVTNLPANKESLIVSVQFGFHTVPTSPPALERKSIVPVAKQLLIVQVALLSEPLTFRTPPSNCPW